jgi:hypothetical protein
VRGEKAVRDFLFGNLKLWALCNWGAEPKKGHVTLRNMTFFFDDESRRLSDIRSIYAGFILYRHKSEVANRDGVGVKFEYS